jgi:putative membrane protein
LSAGFAFHPGPATAPALGWTWDPLPFAALALAAGAYACGVGRLWRVAGVGHGLRLSQIVSFGLGIATALLALVSPLDALSDRLFAAHMTQHELLMVVAAPLVVLGRPLTAYLWALPLEARSSVAGWLHRPTPRYAWYFVSAPLFVLVLHGVVRWIWHVPWLFEAAMRHEALHALQHLSFFATAALFWWALVHGRYGKLGYGLAVLFVFATALHTSVLGALISVAPRVLYHIYESRTAAYGWDALADQQLAGLIMWVPGGLLFLVSALALFAAWLGEAEHRARRAESPAAPQDS